MPLGVSTVREMYCDNEDCDAYDGIQISAEGDGWNTPMTYPSDCPICGGQLHDESDGRWIARDPDEPY